MAILCLRVHGVQGDEGWHELGRALYQPKGQDQMKLNLHRTLCNVKDSQGMTGLSLAVQGECPQAPLTTARA